ncbi:hypothetical protein BJX64DRAFT_270550 [Aspergillus heterothallicus]
MSISFTHSLGYCLLSLYVFFITPLINNFIMTFRKRASQLTQTWRERYLSFNKSPNSLVSAGLRTHQAPYHRISNHLGSL